MNRRVVKPKEQKHYQRSLSAFSRLVRLVQAARPLAGCSRLAALGRDQILQTQHINLALRQTGRMNEPSEFREPLAPLARQPEVRPNTSIEPTSTGWARYALYSLSASRAQPVPAAHVKR
jgi:hypothetical protein